MRALCLLGLLLSLSATSFAKEPAAPTALERCLKRYQHSTCRVFYARHDGVSVHAQPSESSEVMERLDASETLLVDWKATRAGPRDWVRLESGVYSATPGWIRAAAIVGVRDFRRVVGCWPIKRFWYEVGDSRFEADTRADGLGPAPFPNGKRLKVWSKDSLILFDTELGGGTDVFHYDSVTRTLRKSYRFEDSGIEYLDDADSPGCVGGLKLQPVTGK